MMTTESMTEVPAWINAQGRATTTEASATGRTHWVRRAAGFTATSLLCGVSALAQQPAAPAAPAPPLGPSFMLRTPSNDAARSAMRDRVRDATRNIQIVTSNGMRSDSRIAPPGIWWKNTDLAQKIGLTAEQQRHMDEVFQNSRIQLIDLKANLEKQEVTLEPMLDTNPLDSKRVLAQIGHVADARAELEKGNAAMLLGIRGLLTPEQWTKLQADEKTRHHFTFGSMQMPGSFSLEMPDMAMLNGDLAGLSSQLEVLNEVDVDAITADAMKKAQESLDQAQRTMRERNADQEHSSKGTRP